MNKNVKSIFLVVSLLILLVSIGAVSASDISDDTTTLDDTTSSITAELTTTPTVDNDAETTQNIKKEEKNIKTSTKTVEVNDYDELSTAINAAAVDTENEEHIINLNDGTYSLTNAISFSNSTTIPKTIIINGNNQVLTSSWQYIQLNNKCNITFNDLTIEHPTYTYTYTTLTLNNVKFDKQQLSTQDNVIINNSHINGSLNMQRGNVTIENTIIDKYTTNGYNSNTTFINTTLNAQLNNNGNLTIFNSTLNGTLSNGGGKVTIDDNTLFLDNFVYTDNPNSVLIINDTNRIAPYLMKYNGTYTLENMTISTKKNNQGNLTIKNCTLNSTITNTGNLTITDDCVFGETFAINGNGNIFYPDMDELLPYLENYNGTYTLDNLTISSIKSNYGNLTINNSILTASQFNNYNNTTILNSIINTQINNFQDSTLYIDNSTINKEFYRYSQGYDVVINNSVINTAFSPQYPGNFTIINSIINGEINNEYNVNITVINSTLNSTINNDGKITIADDCTYTDNFLLDGDGKIIVNDTTRIAPYLVKYNGDYTLENVTIKSSKTNYGNLTIRNSTINSRIRNSGNLTIADDVSFGESASITSSGVVIINDSNRIYPYTTNYNGNHTLKNITIDKNINNYGNLTLNDTIINKTINNNQYANLTICNSTINSTISQDWGSSDVYIDDDCIAGDGFKIEGNIKVHTNNTGVIETLQNNGIIITDTIIENEIIDYPITNYANVTIKNSTLNSTIINYGTISIDDDCIIGENLNIDGNGNIIISDITPLLPYYDTINGTYTIKDHVFNGWYTIDGNITLDNCTITSNIGSNYGTLYVNDCTINMSRSTYTWINNYGLIFINNETNIINGTINGIGDVFIGVNPEDVIIGPKEYNEDTIIENTTLWTKFTNNANLTIINTNISTTITNNANINFINCSFSNNNMTLNGISTSLAGGFLIKNYGNINLTNCIMENNTFNGTTTTTGFLTLIGAIINNAGSNITIKDSLFNNNNIGYALANEAWGRGTAMGTGTILYNNGNAEIKNSTFTDNFAGMTGGAITSIGTLNVDNCTFTNNSATRDGGAISVSNGNASITNSNFTHNYIENVMYSNGNQVLGGGAIAPINGYVNIDNCNFDENYADCIITGLYGVWCSGGTIGVQQANVNINNSIFKHSRSDRGGVINNGHAYIYASTTTNITNCIFEENDGKMGLIYNRAKMNINNNTFKNNQNATSVIYLQTDYKTNITNNKFIDNNMTTETIYTTQTNSIRAENNTYTNTTINDKLTLDIPSKIFEDETITITGTYEINNPSYYDENILEQNKFNIYINGVLTYTLDELSFDITPTSGNMILVVQPTISQTRSRNMLTSTKLATITPENYDTYIYEGELLGIAENSQVNFAGNFTDKGEIFISTPNIVLDGSNATFTNTTFTLDKTNITIQNMNIQNTNTSYPIKSFMDNNIIQNNNISICNSNGDTAAIYVKASNTLITNNTLNVTGPAGNIDWDADSSGICTTQAILVIESQNNTITYNTITVNGTDTGDSFGTIEGITNSRKVENSLIAYNNLSVTGGYFNYGINQLDRVNNSTVTENNILVTGFRYADGIQIGDNATNIIITKNNITCICLNDTPVDEAALTYGIITTCQGGEPSDNFTITENNIDLTGAVNYGMEIYKTTNTQITQNNITANGNYSMGIGLAYSPNSQITQNNINTNGDSSTFYSVTEEIQPANVGIKVQQNSDNVTIDNNNIITHDKKETDKTVDTDSYQTTITNNQLTSSTGYGRDTIKTTQTDTTIENNIIETAITLEDITSLVKTPTIITATVTTENGDNINGGTVTFTDANGNTIATSTVTDGTATATATFKEASESTITATYTPTSTGLTGSSTEATITVKDKFQTSITIDEITATAGETITIKANVLDENGDAVTGGKVTFKVNGKTLKDSNGKVIYAKVTDGVATADYLVPANMNGKDINITAVYSGSSKYAKTTEEITTTVAEATPTLTTSDITATAGETITLTATITDGDNTINTGKVVFKINGKTVKDTNGKVIYAKVSNNQVNFTYTLPENMKAKDYNLTATFISSDYDKLEDVKTLTVTV